MKKVIALFIYILIFSAIPVIVYNWPIEVEKEDISNVNPEDYGTMEIIHKMDIFMAEAVPWIHTIFAVVICFFISVWISFATAIWKCRSPHDVSTFFSMGIWIFNVICVLICFLIVHHYIILQVIYYYATILVFVLGLLAFLHVILMSASLVLLIVGIGNGKRIAKITPPMTPQIPQSSQHPQS